MYAEYIHQRKKRMVHKTGKKSKVKMKGLLLCKSAVRYLSKRPKSAGFYARVKRLKMREKRKVRVQKNPCFVKEKFINGMSMYLCHE